MIYRGIDMGSSRSVLSLAAIVALASVVFLLLGCGTDRCHPNGKDVADEDDAIKNGTCAPEDTAFADTYACSRVEGPCPESSGVASAKVAENPLRLEDPDLAWATAQLAACSCSCCHHIGAIADHRWAWDFTPVWTDSATGGVLETLMETADSEYRIDGRKNNGFSVSALHLPTTDAARMEGFLTRELGRR